MWQTLLLLTVVAMLYLVWSRIKHGRLWRTIVWEAIRFELADWQGWPAAFVFGGMAILIMAWDWLVHGGEIKTWSEANWYPALA